jgi:signal transduction histidine kinase
VVDQLLELAALESGHATVSAAPVDLAEVVAAAVTDARPAADARGIVIHEDRPAHLAVTGDGDRLRQVVDHLLDNAVKYSPDNATVTVTVSGSDDVAELSVTDTGAGLPTDEQPHLLRRLYRGSNARHSGIPGAGLGLTISRAIADRHRGTLTITMRRPSGTTVTVRLPRAVPSARR